MVSNSTLAAMFKADPTLKVRMYEDYCQYYTDRGVELDALMTFDEWQKHLRIEDW